MTCGGGPCARVSADVGGRARAIFLGRADLLETDQAKPSCSQRSFTGKAGHAASFRYVLLPRRNGNSLKPAATVSDPALNGERYSVSYHRLEGDARITKSESFFIVLALALPAASHAQTRAAPSDAVEFFAEHRQWEIDHQRWASEHVALAHRLRAVADAIARGDEGLARHGSEISVHGAALARGIDDGRLAATHARLRSEHEEARIAHHELVDAVRHLEQIARADETSRATEANQREPAPRR